jgi:hypothetical protein
VTARNPTLTDAVREAVDQARSQIRTMVPAQVVAYDPVTQLASVTVTRLARTAEGTPIEPTVISGRPVAWPRGGGMVIYWDLLPGDDVMLLCADRELDGWQYGAPGTPAIPRRSRTHSLSDAVVYPGLSRTTDPIAAPRIPGTLYIGSEVGAASITVSQAGVALGQPVAADPVVLAGLLQAALTAIVTAAPVVPTDGGAAFKAGLIAGLSTLAAQSGATLVRGV